MLRRIVPPASTGQSGGVGPVLGAVAFAFGGPASLLAFLAWSGLGGFGVALSGAAALLALAGVLGRRRSARLSGLELSLYWLGASVALQIGTGALFVLARWRWFGEGSFLIQLDYLASGLFAGAAIVIASAGALLRWRWAAAAWSELAVYGLGFFMAAASLLAILFGDRQWRLPGMEAEMSGLVAAAAMAVAAGVVLGVARRRRV